MRQLETTTIGAFPKPEYVHLPDWFGGVSTMMPDATITTSQAVPDAAIDEAVERGIREVVRDQVDAGIDVPTDGEVRREHYVHYHCRHLDGIDFDRLTPKLVRNGTWQAELPTFVGPVEAGEPFLDHDYGIAQSATDRPVKITMPGPLTIMDTTADAFYGSELDWGYALAAALNHEVRALARAGCTQIQVDEPVFARYPDRAASYGFELLDIVFSGVGGEVTRTLHICCGYPDRLDNMDYPKADPAAYLRLAHLVEESSVDAISVEDAHRRNDLDLFDAFQTTIVVLGVAQIANSRVETVPEITDRIEAVLTRVPPERLRLAPDCGLGMLPRRIALQKLRNLRAAADGAGP